MKADFLSALAAYIPQDAREAEEKDVILSYARQFPDTVLLRENRVAHITSSAFIVNEAGDKMLMAHHAQRGVWAWAGGHADGDADLMGVARKEAEEETGIFGLRSLMPGIASLDVLHVHGHIKHGRWVNAHLHFSAAYLFVADETGAALRFAQARTLRLAGCRWRRLMRRILMQTDVYLYGKLAARAPRIAWLHHEAVTAG